MSAFYQVLRGKVRDVALAAPQPNPHLWIAVAAASHTWFATINVRSDKERDGAPPGHANLYYLVDDDFRHPLVPSIVARAEGLSPPHATLGRDYPSGALDYQRGALFNPNAMRVLQPGAPGENGLAERLTSLFRLAKDQGHDVIFYGRTFKMTKPHQTDAAFGYTPDGPFGVHNIHMAQGDQPGLKVRDVENGIFGDGACFLWDESARRMTAIFLAFQAQAWHTDDTGAGVAGATGDEPPAYDYDHGGLAVPPPPRAAELTSVHVLPDGGASVTIANMTANPLDLGRWTLSIDDGLPLSLPAQTLRPAEPMAVALPGNAFDAKGGVLMLLNDSGLRVDSVAYAGGDPAKGWSDSFG
jgi:uncharacterized protein YukJ